MKQLPLSKTQMQTLMANGSLLICEPLEHLSGCEPSIAYANRNLNFPYIEYTRNGIHISNQPINLIYQMTYDIAERAKITNIFKNPRIPAMVEVEVTYEAGGTRVILLPTTDKHAMFDLYYYKNKGDIPQLLMPVWMQRYQVRVTDIFIEKVKSVDWARTGYEGLDRKNFQCEHVLCTEVAIAEDEDAVSSQV